MLVYENFLSEEALKLCDLHREKIIKREITGWTNMIWAEGLRKNSSLIFVTSFPEITEYVFDKISKINSNFYYSQITTNFCIWGPGSKLNLHNDDLHLFAGTIYLNDDWNPEDGGLFMWRKDEASDFQVVLPEYNKAIINSNAEAHQVTQLSPASTNLRYTVQIWGAELEEHRLLTETSYFFS